MDGIDLDYAVGDRRVVTREIPSRQEQLTEVGQTHLQTAQRPEVLSSITTLVLTQNLRIGEYHRLSRDPYHPPMS
jgi:hypothetical protein